MMLIVFSLAFLLVAACVGIHYNVLVFLSAMTLRLASRQRWLINVMIFGAILTHIVEMTLFAIVYWMLCESGQFGAIHDSEGIISSDYWYFSFVVYTSLGFGDLVPSGAIRMMTAIETLTGLVLIAWTASFMFVEMQSWAAQNLEKEVTGEKT